MSPTSIERSSGSPPPSWARLGLVLFLLMLTIWGGLFIASTSCVIDGRRHFALIDDAMISMAYARNLVEGFGLDWSRRGEPVEGFTHPLWLALLVPVQWLPLAREEKSLVVQVGGLALWILTVLAVARLVARRHLIAEPAGRAAAVVLTGASFALAHWSLFGMETGLAALLLVALADATLEVAAAGAVDRRSGADNRRSGADTRRSGVDSRRSGADNRRSGVRLGAVAAALYWLRMDLAVPIACAGLWLVPAARARPAVRRALTEAGIGLAGAALALHALRGWLFGDLLPNTYYLKLAGVAVSIRLERGLQSLGEYLLESLLLWAVVLATAWRSRRDSRLGLLLLLVGGQLVYAIAVGGDVWDWDEHVGANRFVAPVLPLAAILAGAGVGRLRTALVGRGAPRSLANGATVAFLLALVLSADGLLWGERAPRLRRLASLRDRPGHAVSNQIVLDQLWGFRRLVQPNARVATIWAGIPAYFSDFRMVDAFGYNDRKIAREAPHPSGERADGVPAYTPGHAKWDFPYVIEQLHPDAFFQAWGPPEPELVALLRARGYRPVGGFWLAEASPNLTRFSRQRINAQRRREARPTS